MDKLIYCDRNDVSFAAYDDCLDYNDGGAVGNGDDSEKDGDVNDNFNDAGNDMVMAMAMMMSIPIMMNIVIPSPSAKRRPRVLISTGV